MSLLQDMTYISLRGSKESVIRMLNAVIRNVGGGDIITGSDDLETINSKIKDEKDGYGFRISIPDLLDDKCMEDSQLLEKKAAYENPKSNTASSSEQEDEEFEDFMEDFSTDERMIDILGVYLHEGGFDVEFEMYECENCAYYSDWLGWGDISRIYGCKVLVANDLYRNGRFEDFCGTVVYMPKGESVEESRIKPELDVCGYDLAFDKLIELSPETYRQKKIRCMEEKIGELKGFINSEKLLIVKESLELNDGRAEIPEGVTAIDGLLFAGCKELRSIFIPASVKYIDTNAFWGSNLESIEVHPDNPNFCVESNCLLSKDKTTLLIGFKDTIIPSSVTSIKENAFSGCIGLKEIEIPGTVQTIGNNAFKGCQELERVRIGDGVREIGGEAFGWCKALKDISIPDSVTTIYGGAFRRCSSLREIVFPESVADYLSETFEGCTSLEHVAFSGNIRDVGMNCFRGCTALTGITIPEGVVKICYGAFVDCTSLADVVIPESLSEIDGHAFDGCPCAEDLASRYPDLIRIEETEDDDEDDDDDRTAENELIDENGHAVIPEGAVEIEEHAFECCRGLASIDIPGSVREIGFAAFFKCTGLTSIVIPEGVTAIEEFTFWGCTSLVSVSIPESIKEISSDAFEGCPCEDEILEKYKDIIN